MITDRIRQLASQIHAKAVDDRRTLHSAPELSFQEYETSRYIQKRLDEMGIPNETIANTGVQAVIKGKQPSDKIIALRADIDALPIRELNKTSYASRNDQVMHACGHDAHTSSLLGTAFILSELSDSFGGTVKLIFQPGEEILPGGAGMVIKEGFFERDKPSSIIGQHVSPMVPAGKIAIRKGSFMASMDEIRVTVHGKGGHGAQPHQNTDPVIISAHILIALQQIVSRFANPSTPTVLSFGKVQADGAINVIPDRVYMEGTFRTFDEKWRKEAHSRMKKMAETIAGSMGGSCDFDIVEGYPSLFNNELLTTGVKGLAEEYLGSENVVDADIWTASEDFARYSQITDGCFYLLGIRNEEKGITSSLHTPTFDIDEDALKISTGLMAYIAIRLLAGNDKTSFK